MIYDIGSKLFIVLYKAVNVEEIQRHIELLLSQVQLTVLVTGNILEGVRGNHSCHRPS